MCRDCLNWIRPVIAGDSPECSVFEENKPGKTWSEIKDIVIDLGHMMRKTNGNPPYLIEPFHGYTRRNCKFFRGKK